jgi:hypothetical protein
MVSIARLLEQHWHELQALRIEYWKYAISTARSDRERLEHAITRIYQQHGLEKPAIVWAKSLLHAKLLSGLCTYISDPYVHFSMSGTFGLYGGKERYVLAYSNIESANHKISLQNEFPTMYTESKACQTVAERIWLSMYQSNVDGTALYRALHGPVPVVSTNPLKIIEPEVGQSSSDTTMLDTLGGDRSGEPLPAVLGMIGAQFFDEFEQQMVEFDDRQWLELWHEYSANNENWAAFGPKFMEMSREKRSEVVRFLSRITAQRYWGFFTPIRDAMSCAREQAMMMLGQEWNAKFDAITDAVKAGGWWCPFEGICIALDNPAELHFDAQDRLHNENGMAVRLADDWGLWAIDGVRVPDIVVRNQFSSLDIDSEPNAEVRRIMLNRYGITKYMLESGAQEIQHDECGRLYRKTLPDGKNLCLVEVINKTPEPDGSFKIYHLSVPPEITSAREGVAWTFGLSKDEYAPQLET